jgi:hypothetical protein
VIIGCGLFGGSFDVWLKADADAGRSRHFRASNNAQ